MLRIALTTLMLLGLSGCASTVVVETPAPDPVQVRDETAFIDAVRANAGSGASMFTDAELIENGDNACESASESDRTMGEAVESLIEYGIREHGASQETTDYLEALYLSAEAFLCA